MALFSTHLHRKIDLSNAFKSCCRDDSFKSCSKIAGFLGKQRLGFLGECACEKLRSAGLEFATDLKRAVNKVSDKSLAQGQAVLSSVNLSKIEPENMLPEVGSARMPRLVALSPFCVSAGFQDLRPLCGTLMTPTSRYLFLQDMGGVVKFSDYYGKCWYDV